MIQVISRSCILAASLITAAAYAQDTAPKYQLDQKQTRVVQMSSLSPGSDCQPARLAGRVIKREFDDSALIVTGVVIEKRDGSRDFVAIDLELENASMADREWLITGLQTLLQEGKQVSLGVKLCGAAGRVVVLDSIRPLP
jgi:hypothetical protein